tara:strand:+ start:482 stop:718 length:237 start_codon:yes stop_codon:yes gene_type:complete
MKVNNILVEFSIKDVFNTIKQLKKEKPSKARELEKKFNDLENSVNDLNQIYTKFEKTFNQNTGKKIKVRRAKADDFLK